MHPVSLTILLSLKLGSVSKSSLILVMFLQNLWWSLVTGFNWPGLVEVVWGMFQHSSCAIIFLVVDYTAAFAAAASFVGEREKFLFRYNNPHPTKTSFNSIVEVQKWCKSNDQYLGSQEVLARFACPNRVKWQINKKNHALQFGKSALSIPFCNYDWLL